MQTEGHHSQHQRLRPHPHVDGDRRSKLLIHSDKGDVRRVEEFKIPQDSAHSSLFIPSFDTHVGIQCNRAFNLPLSVLIDEIAPILIIRIGRNPGGGVGNHLIPQTVLERAGRDVRLPGLHIAVRGRLLSYFKNPVKHFPGHFPIQITSDRTPCIDRINQTQFWICCQIFCRFTHYRLL